MVMKDQVKPHERLKYFANYANLNSTNSPCLILSPTVTLIGDLAENVITSSDDQDNNKNCGF